MANEISNEVQASREMRVLHDRLMEANAKLARWHMTFEAKVRPSFDTDLFDVHVQARVGDKVFNRILTPYDIEYFVSDKATITEMLSQTFIAELLAEVSRDELGIILAPAIDNAEKLNAARRK